MHPPPAILRLIRTPLAAKLAWHKLIASARCALLLLFAAASLCSSHALTVPRSETFDAYATGDTTPSGFTERGSLSPALITLQNATPFGKCYGFQLAGAGQLTSLAQFTNLGGRSFSIYAQFSLASFTAAGGNMNTQVVALASDSLAADGYRLSFVLATDMNAPNAARGKLSLSRAGASGVYSAGSLSPAPGIIYTLTLTGRYRSATSLSLVGTLSDGTKSVSVHFDDSEPAYAGQHFGFRVASDHQGNVATTVFDNFRIAPCGAPSAITVNFSQSNGSISHLADGFLHGLSPTKPDDTIIDQVGVRALRAAPLYLDYDRFVYIRNSNPAFLGAGTWTRVMRQSPVIVGNLAYNTARVVGKPGAYFPGDDDDWATWTNIISQLVTQAEAEGFRGAYSVWNEPNAEFTAHGGFTRFQTAYLHAYRTIKARSPIAKVVGPEISSYNLSLLTSFLTFAKVNNALPQVLTWHELIGDPSLIKGHVDEIKSWMAANGVSVPEIYITEHGSYDDFTRPGSAGAFLAYLENAGVNYAFKANWPRPFFAVSGNIPSLVTPDGTKLTAVGQVYRGYNQMSGIEALATTQNPRIPALGSVDTSRNSAWVLLSHADPATGMKTLNVTLQALPSGLVLDGRTRVKVQLIPDTGIAAATPETIFDAEVVVAVNEASLAVDLNQYEAAFLTVTPPQDPDPHPWTIVDDASPTIAYSTEWQTPAEPNYYNATRHTTGNTGAYAEFTFTGTRLKVYTKRDFNNGIYSIYVDDMATPVAEVDAYAPSAQFQQLTYQIEGLAPGAHKIRIRVTGRKRAASAGCFIGIDKFEYAP